MTSAEVMFRRRPACVERKCFSDVRGKLQSDIRGKLQIDTQIPTTT
jgi:hypothetical protein